MGNGGGGSNGWGVHSGIGRWEIIVVHYYPVLHTYTGFSSLIPTERYTIMHWYA